MTEGETAAEGQKTSDSTTELKILRQIEYYFGDYNLPRDKFMQEEIKKEDGWIPLETMTKFKRLASLSTDQKVIAAALRSSSSAGFIEVNEAGDKIRRCPSHPLPPLSEEVRSEVIRRTVYCKGFPKDASLDDLLDYFHQFGPYESVRMRHYFNKCEERQGFKGSVLAVFPSQEAAEAFKEKTGVKYGGTYLVRKWYEDYAEEKRKEVEERRAKKEARKAKEEQQGGDKGSQAECPDIDSTPGTFLHFSGLAASSEVTREDLKEALGEFSEDCAWIGFSRGLTEGFLRLREKDSNRAVMEKLGGRLRVGAEAEAALRLVEGAEEEEQFAKLREARSKRRATFGKKRKVGQGRGGGGGGPHYKRRK